MKCIVEDCDKEAKCKGLCWMHYKREQIKFNRGSYNEYQREYKQKIADKVKEYHQTDAYKISHRKSQAKYYATKIK